MRQIGEGEWRESDIIKQYQDDPDRKKAVEIWRSLGGGVDRFKEMFPNDEKVLEHEKRQTDMSAKELQLHIEAIESGLPVTRFMDDEGLTTDLMVRRMKQIIDNGDDGDALKAIRIALKLRFPDEKPIRINPTQVNNITIQGEGEKERMVEEIMRKISGPETE
jgi:hypothetical protein